MNHFLFVIIFFSHFIVSAQDNSENRFLKSAVDDNNNYTNVGNIGLTVTNWGVFGDGLAEQSPVDQPSCEYPRGSSIEHIFDGGLWVGAFKPSAGQNLVTTGAFNSARIGTAGSNNFEYTNTDVLTDIITERSTITDANFYSPAAISHQDFIAEFSDTNIFVPGTAIQIPNHTPLGIAVHLESYAWNFPFADAFAILNYTITNVGHAGIHDTLRNVHVGLWADMVVRNTNILPPRVGAPFYQDVGAGFVNDPDIAKLIYAYEYDGGPNYTNSQSYVSLTFLGADPVDGDNTYAEEINYNWWLFGGGTEDWELAPNTEEARYQRMSQSISDIDYMGGVERQSGNFMSLITTGPFEEIPPGESINVVFAVVCGKKFSNLPHSADNEITRKTLIENVSWAQRAYHGEDSNRNGVLDFMGTDSSEDVIPNGVIDRYILPTPPTPPKLKVTPSDSKVTLLWSDDSENSIDFISKTKDFEGYRVYRSFLGNDLSTDGIFANMQLIREYDNIDGLFYDTGLESIELAEPIIEISDNDPPDTVIYKYQLEIDNLHNGWQYAFAVTAFDSGDAGLNLQSLESTSLLNALIVSPGSPAREKGSGFKVGVYPNPYKAGALWDGGLERQRKLFFFNLPARSVVRIYTLAGDLVDEFRHSGNYDGRDIEWYQKFADVNTQTIFPGGEHAWDMVTENDQAIATGLYLFTVKDEDSGKVQRGKFVVIK